VRFSTPIQTGTGSLPGVKWPRHGTDYPPPSSAEVEGRVELQSAPPLGLHGYSRENFTFTSFTEANKCCIVCENTEFHVSSIVM
jgi:hypothetical protein